MTSKIFYTKQMTVFTDDNSRTYRKGAAIMLIALHGCQPRNRIVATHIKVMARIGDNKLYVATE